MTPAQRQVVFINTAHTFTHYCLLILATAVLVTRVIGTVVDGGRDHPYTRMAIPVETALVVAVAAVRLLA